MKRIEVVFYQTHSGSEPVKEWLNQLSLQDKKAIGKEIKKVEYGWPLGMPLVRKMDVNIWEVRVILIDKIARVLFTIKGTQMVLLTGFIKKSQKTPSSELTLAKQRLKDI